MTRIFKVKNFARFQRKEQIQDEALIKAIVQADKGLVDANLGSGLMKLRIARKGQGKSGGFRTIIAFHKDNRAVFLFGFAKNERSNIDEEELEAFKILAKAYLTLSNQQIAELITHKDLEEIKYDQFTEDKKSTK